jgi:hypothetical protein
MHLYNAVEFPLCQTQNSERRHPHQKKNMEDLLTRGWEQLIGRETGPMMFRLIVQPLVATLLAIRAGMRDARSGRPAFFWAAVLDPKMRIPLLRNGWKDIGKLFFVAATLDIIYQLIVFQWIYPLQVLIVAAVLAIVPYLMVRGLTNRIVRTLQRGISRG